MQTGSEIEKRNLTVAVGNLFGVHEYLRNRYIEMRLIPMDNDYQVIQAVRNHQADIGVTDVASLMYLINENNISDIYKIGDTGYIYNYSFAVPKSMPLLRNILDEAIESIPQSFQQSVLEKWDVDSSGIQRLIGDQFTQNSADVVDKKYVTILVIVVGLLIIFIDFLIQRYLLKRRDEEHMHNIDSHLIEDLKVSRKK